MVSSIKHQAPGIMNMNAGPTQPLSESVHAEKYRQKGENYRESVNRWTAAMADDEAHYHAFRDLAMPMRFMAAGRVQAAMGAVKTVTPYNCFVSGTIEDSFTDGEGSIMNRAVQAAATLRMGGGIGYDFSTLRPNGALIRKLGSTSTGPLSFMEIYDSVCKCVSSSGHRRGAQMGVLRVDHPDIQEFIHAKQNQDRFRNFNLSIAVTDAFMHALRDGTPFTLQFEGRAHGQIDARNLWESIMRSTWDWAEPGVLFIDTINKQNNLRYCETIAATNPCGEQPLPPFGACLLGSFNLVKYLKKEGRRVFFDWDLFYSDIPIVVRGMDNVVDRATYPLYEQEKEAKNKRRMGLGITGTANALEAMGLPYGSDGYLAQQDQILKALAIGAYRASIDLAAEKGAFPLYKKKAHLETPFIEQMMQAENAIFHGINNHGIRNSHLTSIAPTGTISLCADNITSGIEPVFTHRYTRDVNMPGGMITAEVVDYGLANFGVEGKTSDEVSASQHVSVLTNAQRWVDSAVSKTCNVSPDMPWSDFKDIYIQAWLGGAKGCTTFNSGGKRFGILRAKEEEPEEGAACFIDQETGRRECS